MDAIPQPQFASGSHARLDARSLAMHCLIAEKIRAEPALLARVRETIRRWRSLVCVQSQPYLTAWEELLDQGMEVALSVATEDSERAAALRQSTPFVGILSNAERFAFLKAWKERRP